VHAVEKALASGWTMRRNLRNAREVFERITGTKLDGYDWLHELERKLGTAEAGVDVAALRRISRDLTRVNDYVAALLPPEAKP
jgi:hypothetical protein